MGFGYDMSQLMHIYVDDDKYMINNEDEADSEMNEPSTCLKDKQKKTIKKTTNDTALLNIHKNIENKYIYND